MIRPVILPEGSGLGFKVLVLHTANTLWCRAAVRDSGYRYSQRYTFTAWQSLLRSGNFQLVTAVEHLPMSNVCTACMTSQVFEKLCLAPCLYSRGGVGLLSLFVLCVSGVPSPLRYSLHEHAATSAAAAERGGPSHDERSFRTAVGTAVGILAVQL